MVELARRVVGGFSLHAHEKPELCRDHHKGPWRVVECNGSRDTDVIECARCGAQRQTRCTFDEDYA